METPNNMTPGHRPVTPEERPILEDVTAVQAQVNELFGRLPVNSPEAKEILFYAERCAFETFAHIRAAMFANGK